MKIKIHFEDGSVIVHKNPSFTDFISFNKIRITANEQEFSYGKENIDFILISEVSKKND